jgi:hypothetical protein
MASAITLDLAWANPVREAGGLLSDGLLPLRILNIIVGRQAGHWQGTETVKRANSAVAVLIRGINA